MGFEKRSHVFSAEKTDELGSRNFVCDGKQNIRDRIPIRQKSKSHFEAGMGSAPSADTEALGVLLINGIMKIMKNSQKGFVVPVLLAIIALLTIGGGVYVYKNKRAEVPVIDTTTQANNSSSDINSISNNQKVITNNSVIAFTVLSPNGGEKYEGGKTYDIKWSSNSTKNVDIGLIEGSKDSGQGAGYVALNIPNSGNYKWTISSSIHTGQYRIFVRPAGEGSIEDISDSTFTITAIPLTLTNSEALALVKATWGGCTPDSCSEVLVSVSNTGGVTYVTATYEGLRDDSSSASRKIAPAHYDYGYKAWVLETPVITQRCQPGRGHQDFSSEPCI